MIRKIFQFYWPILKPYKWWMFLSFQTLLTAPLYNVGYHYSIKLLIDALVENEVFVWNNIAFPVFLYLFLEVFSSLYWRLSNFGGLKSMPYIENGIMLKAYEYVQQHSYQFFVETPNGSIVSKIKGLVDGHNNILNNIHFEIGASLIHAIFILIFIGLVSVKLSILMLVLASILGVFSIYFGRKVERNSTQMAIGNQKNMGRIADVLSNFSTLFAFSARKREYQNLQKNIEENVLPYQKKAWIYEIIFQSVNGFIYLIILALTLYYIVTLRYANEITVGDIAFILGMTLGFMEYSWRTFNAMDKFFKEWGDLKASFSIFEIPNEIDPNESKILQIKKPEIIFENINFSYKDREVFKNLNLKISAGEKIGLVGLSGAGKSTIVNLLLRYLETQSGKILIDQKNIYEFSKNSLRENIGIIPQDIVLFNRSLKENLTYGKPNATQEEIESACKKASIHDFIISCEQGYETLVGERGIKLSGGQRQRIGIARAILKNAPILILDEATSSLDSESEAHIQNAINHLLDENITVIAIAHRLATLKHVDRILVLEEGKIVEEGKHDELLAKKGLYQKLWEMQQI